MCGRFAYFGKGFFGYESLHHPPVPPFERYNIAPSQNILALLRDPEAQNLSWSLLRWGLVPFWAKGQPAKFNLINARAEGVERKPSFRGPFTYRRCLIPASGFYEWQKKGRTKQPFFIRPPHSGYFAFAGIWDHWEGEYGEVVESCAILTTTANGRMAAIHERMPVILQEDASLLWLDNRSRKADLLNLLRPCPDDLLEVYPVSARVNSPRNDDPACIEKVG